MRQDILFPACTKLKFNFSSDRSIDKSPFAALDLGGGSTQVTFPVKDLTQTPSLLFDHLHEVTTSKRKADVFATSYLNLGIQAIRHTILTSGKKLNKTNYVNACVHPKFEKEEFEYLDNKYFITGKNNTKKAVDYNECVGVVKEKVIPLVNPKPRTLKLNEIVAFNYFFGAAIQTGLICMYFDI